MKIINKFRDLLKKILAENASAHSIALGFSIGVFIGFMPSYGFQMIPAVAIAMLFRVNKAAAALGVWISNPLTAIPLYMFNFWVGIKLTGTTYAFPKIKNIINEGNISDLFSSGGEFFKILLIGSLLVATISSVVVYFPLRSIMQYRNRRLRKIRENELGM